MERLTYGYTLQKGFISLAISYSGSALSTFRKGLKKGEETFTGYNVSYFGSVSAGR